MYAADISVKIKSAYRARFQQGKFMGTTAPYGYIKDPADHNHLLIDDKVAHVVKEIFDLALKGNGVAQKFADILNKQLSYALPLMRRSVAKQALNVILRGTRTNAIFGVGTA